MFSKKLSSLLSLVFCAAALLSFSQTANAVGFGTGTAEFGTDSCPIFFTYGSFPPGVSGPVPIYEIDSTSSCGGTFFDVDIQDGSFDADFYYGSVDGQLQFLAKSIFFTCHYSGWVSGTYSSGEAKVQGDFFRVSGSICSPTLTGTKFTFDF